MTDEPTADRVARLTAWQPLRRLTDLVHVLADTWRIAGETHDNVNELRSIMATSAEQITAINANLANIQGDVQRLNQLAVELLRRVIAATTGPGDTVLDFFCGSGTTGSEPTP